MSHATNRSDPLERLRAMTDAEALRRSQEREANRKRDPQFAALVEAMGPGARVEFWQSHDGTVTLGKRKDIGSGWVDASVLERLAEHQKWIVRKGK